jgi:hypothetical protein
MTIKSSSVSNAGRGASRGWRRWQIKSDVSLDRLLDQTRHVIPWLPTIIIFAVVLTACVERLTKNWHPADIGRSLSRLEVVTEPHAMLLLGNVVNVLNVPVHFELDMALLSREEGGVTDWQHERRLLLRSKEAWSRSSLQKVWKIKITRWVNHQVTSGKEMPSRSIPAIFDPDFNVGLCGFDKLVWNWRLRVHVYGRYEYESLFGRFERLVGSSPLTDRYDHQNESEKCDSRSTEHFRATPLSFVQGYFLTGVLMIFGLIFALVGAVSFSEGAFLQSAAFITVSFVTAVLSVLVLASTPGFLG